MEIIDFDVLENLPEIERMGDLAFNQSFYSMQELARRLGRGFILEKYWANIAREKELNLGFQISYAFSKESTYLWLLGVIPEFREKGIASKLIDKQIQNSMLEGHKKIVLKTHKGCPEAIRLYEKKGFIHFDTEKDYWEKGKHALWYRKEI